MIRALLAALALALLLAGVQSYRADRLKQQLSASKNEAIQLARTLERADTDAQRADDQCEARISAARTSARAIERIIERPVHVDPKGCAVRDLVGADELRQALTAGAAAPDPVH